MSKMILGTLLCCLAAGCASVRTYTLSQVLDEHRQASQNADQLIAKAKADQREKKALVEQLRAHKAQEIKAVDEDLSGHLTRMEQSLQAMLSQRKAMQEADGQVTSMAHVHTKVSSMDDAYDVVDRAQKTFEASVNDIQRLAIDYSRESRSLGDLISQNKLFFQFDVSAFNDRLKKTARASDNTIESFRGQLERAEGVIAADTDKDLRERREVSLERLKTTAGRYTENAQRFAKIGQEIGDQTLGRKTLSSLDPSWPKVQGLVQEFEELTAILSNIEGEFKRDWDLFRKGS